MAPASKKQPAFNKDDPDGILLDQIFRTAGVNGGLGAADPYKYSPAAIRMMPGFETFQKFNDTQFRKACERAAAREVKRRMSTGEVPEPPRANFHAQAAGAAGAAAGAGGSGRASAGDDTEEVKKRITHDWDPIEGCVETLDGEYYFCFVQLPWATQKGQLSVVVSEDGMQIDISKKKSRAALKPGALLAAFKRNESNGRALHGPNDVRTVAVNKAVKTKQQQSSDPNAYVSVQPIELPWEAERTLYEYKIAEVPVENGQHEVWLYIEVKRIGDQYVPPPETPSVPSGRASRPSNGGGGGSGSGSGGLGSSGNSPSNNNNNDNMDSSPSRDRVPKRSKPSSTNANANQQGASSSSATPTSASASGDSKQAATQSPTIVRRAGPKSAPPMTMQTQYQQNGTPVMTTDQVAELLRNQQQQFNARQDAFQTQMQQEFIKMQVQMGSMHVNAAAFQSIPRGMPRRGIAMGPHAPDPLDDDSQL